MISHLVFIGIAAIAIPLDISHVASVEVSRIRGISISVNSLYTPNTDFECLDGSGKITFDKVNDDYCDCGDGSDEPGTSACSNGSFFCQNSGYKSLHISSGRVNDGICDCCDGTDEYTSDKHCVNICDELGKEANAEAEKTAQLFKEGNKIRIEMMAQGKKLKNEHTVKLTKYKSDYEEAELVKKEKEIIRNEAEEREKVALEKYKPHEPEPTQSVNNEGDDRGQLTEAEEYFKMLDKDESGTVTMLEIQHLMTFDKDGNGVITEEEAMYFLGHQHEVNLQEFIEKSWSNIKPFIMREQGSFEPPKNDAENDDAKQIPDQTEKHHYDHVDDNFGGADDEYDDENEEEPENEIERDDGDDHQEIAHDDDDQEQEPSKIEYDEETQSIVDEATAARTQYHQAEKALLDLQNEIRGLEGKIGRDYGPDDVFASLDGQCFQFTNFEYIYSMCMYGRTTQSAKSGGSEVLLGQWNDWTGTEMNNKYSQMKFTGGATCWNGPTRSSTVDLRCGLENKLVAVAEPRRCEYTMIFETPAVCNADINLIDAHDEL
ncbi:hypothetical protein PV325_009236 [Microctonus aethiopoides]|uniref:Glucosidase 2 subunit beta n=1 Tax=Microctonus aethiopoides TaxID=144406 RepID=A0AA39FUY9_9HYME|nr:hypothetical protein PV325_009236 [Microctonus aethiopoides]KAK0093295.1 hypothetical protein PV326_013889 [Microctonus aethiopoides]KAK0175955.1 hypothetical protein PV328_000143 [Microctonus aethiopoides]